MSGAVNPRVAALIFGDGAEQVDPKLSQLLKLQEQAPAFAIPIEQRPGDAGFVTSIENALSRLPADVDWIWLLDAGVEITPDTLAQLTRRVEISPSATMVGAKQLQQRDRSLISSMGISISQLAEPVRLNSGEFDQGQHDADSDVLSVDLGCTLVLREALLAQLASLAESPREALAYEFGMRLRAAGGRVLVEPAARCWVNEQQSSAPISAEFAKLTSRVHLAVLVFPILWVIGLWLVAPLLLPFAIASALVRKLPAQAIAAPAAILWGWATIWTRLRARASLRELGEISSQRDFWLSRNSLRKLRMVKVAQTSQTQETRLRLFESGAIWWAALPLLLSYQLFPVGVPSSAGSPPISQSLVELIRTAFTQVQPYWDGVPGNSDPSAWFWLVFGLLNPTDPGFAVGWFLFLATALSFLLTARLAAEFTQRRWVVVVLSLAYALNPLLILALLQANVASVAIQLLIPFTVLAARRVWLQPREQSWSWWAGAGLTTFILAALYPLLAGIFAAAFFIAILIRHPQKTSAAALSFAPVFSLCTFYALDLLSTDAAALLMLPTVLASPPAESWLLLPLAVPFLIWGLAIERLSIADRLTALLLISAAASWFWLATLAQLLLSAALVLALVAIAGRTPVRLAVGPNQSSVISITKGLPALVTLTALTGGLLLAAQPPQFQWGSSALMPALVTATATSDPMVRTLVIDATAPTPTAQLIWNDGRHQDEISLRLELTGSNFQLETKQQIAELVAGLLAGNSQVATVQLESLKVGYILVQSPTPEITRSLSTISGLASSGLTEFGELWRNGDYRAAQPSPVSPSAAQIPILALLAILVLLAIPKPRFGRRAAEANPIFDEVTE